MTYWRYNEDKNVIEELDKEELMHEFPEEMPRPERMPDSDERLRRWSEEHKL